MTSWGGKAELFPGAPELFPGAPLTPVMGVLKTEVADSTWVSYHMYFLYAILTVPKYDGSI
jgi:hypothetical protein